MRIVLNDTELDIAFLKIQAKILEKTGKKPKQNELGAFIFNKILNPDNHSEIIEDYISQTEKNEPTNYQKQAS